MLWLLLAGLGAAFWLGGLATAAAYGLLVLVVPTLTDAAGVLAALALGIRVSAVEVGWGAAVVDRRGGRVFLVVRSFPVGVAWAGHARTRSLVRTRFWTAHLVCVLALLAAVWVGFVEDAPALACAAAVSLLAQALVAVDASGRASALRQLWTIPRLTDDEVVDWSASRLARAADHALYDGDVRGALALAQRALDEDPDDRLALSTLAGAADRLGDVPAALAASERLLAGGDRSSQIAAHANLAWFLTRAREAGHDVPDWRARASAALDVAEELGERWELQHTRALVQALSGWPDRAEELLAWPESQVLAPDSRATLLLTRAHVHRVRGDLAAARAAVREARELAPQLSRAADVERWIDAPA